jgi:hypothetical protein
MKKFSSNIANWVRLFIFKFKNLYLNLGKSAPKKVLPKNLFCQLKVCLSTRNFGFWANLFLGALFTKVKCTIFKSL